MNMLGIREPNIYGYETYEGLIKFIKDLRGLGNELTFIQSNHEGEIVDAIQQAFYSGIGGIVINAAAYAHTSIAIADALRAVDIPTVEVHISDPATREDYRRHSYIAEVAKTTISGRGFMGYVDAIDFLDNHRGKF